MRPAAWSRIVLALGRGGEAVESESMSATAVLRVSIESDHHLIRLPEELRQRALSEVLRKENLPLNTRCGGRGLCEGCLLELTSGTLVHLASGTTVTADGKPITLRGCEYRAGHAEVSLRLPARSLLRYAPQVVTTFRLNIPAGHDPLAEDVRPGDTGLAIDIGTTTVAVMLVDLTTGAVLATASAFNRQMDLGDDVLTRINLCSMEKSSIKTLQRAIVNETLGPLVAEVLERSAGPQAAGGEPADSSPPPPARLTPSSPTPRIRVATIAANTTMLHLFAGVDPTPMGVAPFTPAFLEHRVVDVRIPGVPADAKVHLLPGCSAYVGADLAAGIVATGMLYSSDTCLLVDIGTNGEIVLKHGGKLYGTATAAGPAFEGAGLSFGLRAGRGAISHIAIGPSPSDDAMRPQGDGHETALGMRRLHVKTEVIGGPVHPTGICGSAYVDFLAQGLQAGVLCPTGRLLVEHAPAAPGRPTHPGEIGPWDEHGRAMCIATGAGREAIVVSELDIAKLLQAKAAIAAGILTLLRRASIEPRDVKTLYLAGGFGMHIDRRSAITCGLIPGFTADQIQVVGNTSLAGAFLSLLDRSLLPDFDRARRDIEIVELNLDPDFENCYIDQLTLPAITESHPAHPSSPTDSSATTSIRDNP
jgi:uncharacterized 2Fe-2S/4Fe-4S cluster protein (DUF4445 family)